MQNGTRTLSKASFHDFFKASSGVKTHANVLPWLASTFGEQ